MLSGIILAMAHAKPSRMIRKYKINSSDPGIRESLPGIAALLDLKTGIFNSFFYFGQSDFRFVITDTRQFFFQAY